MANAASPDSRRFELFKLCVELADRLSARRAGANTFFVSLHSIIASIVGYLAVVRGHKGLDHFSAYVLAAVGVVLSLTWWGILRYYRRLSKAKWDVINEMEQDLPLKPFVREWELLHPKSEAKGWLKKQTHREATVVEQFVPLAFAIVYVLLAVRVSWR